jgi:hypothetical protein
MRSVTDGGPACGAAMPAALGGGQRCRGSVQRMGLIMSGLAI